MFPRVGFDVSIRGYLHESQSQTVKDIEAKSCRNSSGYGDNVDHFLERHSKMSHILYISRITNSGTKQEQLDTK